MAAAAEEEPSYEELKIQLKQEKQRVASLQLELARAKEQNFLVQQQMELEEEALTNKMAKRLSQLLREKQQLANAVEAEEEHISNTLQKRLAQVTAEKVALENQLEQESEYVANRLQKRVETLAAEKLGLQKEKAEMKQQVTELHAAVQKLHADKCALQNAMDAEEEMVVNRLQRQLETLLSNYRVLEARLEAGGVSTKALQIQPMDIDLEGVYGGRRHSSRGRERSLSVSSGGSRRSSLNEIRLARTSSSAIAMSQPSPQSSQH